MFKKIIIFSVLTVSLTGCIVAPFDDGYGYDRRGDRGGYDRDRDRHDRHDYRRDDRRGDHYKDRDHRDWNKR